MANVALRGFAKGELAPSLWGRTDLQQYLTGLRTCRNFLVQKWGGVANRPGTAFVARTKNDGVARLVPFVVETGVLSNVAVLELGDRSLRLHQGGAPVVTSGVAAWADATAYAVADLVTYSGVTYYCLAAHTSALANDRPSTGSAWQTYWYALTTSGAGPAAIYELPTPWLAADLPALQVVQSADVVTLVHPSYPPYELSRLGATRWVLAPITFGPAIGTPGGVAAVGGVAGSDTWYAVTASAETTNEESLGGTVKLAAFAPASGTPVTVSWNAVAGADAYRIYRSKDGVTYGYVATVGGVSNTPVTDTSWATTSATASNTASGSAYAASGSQVRNALTLATASDRAYNGQYTVKLRLTAQNTAGNGVTFYRVRAYYLRSVDAVRQDAGVVFSGYFAGGGTSGPTAITVTVPVPDAAYTSLTLDLVPEVTGTFSGVGTLSCTLDTSAAPNNVVSWTKAALQYSDVAAAADFTQAPPTQPSVFAAVGQYPAAVGLYQQRRLFANTSAQPETVRASRVGSPRSFAVSTPLADDDPVTWTLAGRTVSAVRHLVDAGTLLAFTTSGVYRIEGDDAGILRPDAINPRKIAPHGAGRLPPLEVQQSVVYQQARGSIVRDVTSDALQTEGYTGSDLTIFAPHLFQGHTLVDWCYQSEPLSLVWAVRDDGVLLSLTYVREQAVWAWARHDTQGTVEAVCSVPEGTEDVVYLVVKRTIGSGATVRMVERMASRTVTAATAPRDLYFVDAGLTYDGRNTGSTTVTLTGTTWDGTATLTCTASASLFSASNVGDRVDLLATDGSVLVGCTIEGYTSATVVTVRPDRTVPVALQGVATTAWALAVDTVSGLGHLEGLAVSALGDGVVLASPNNGAYPRVVVTGGAATLPSPAAVIQIGLPYISDLETLDLDTPAGQSLKPSKVLIQKVTVQLDATRGLWAGTRRPDDQPADGGVDDGGRSPGDPLYRMHEPKVRESEAWRSPVALLTGLVHLPLDGAWQQGRVALRQVDPLPATILSVIPTGTF